jgi:putative peptidoglycan lipid II flippase
MAFLALGDIVAATVLQTGRFRREDTVYVWMILAGSAVGLLASTLGRLYSSAYYALRDTRTPVRYTIVRVVLTTVLGYLSRFRCLVARRRRHGCRRVDRVSRLAGWVEMLLLRATMNGRSDRPGCGHVYGLLWGAAAAAAAAAEP